MKRYLLTALAIAAAVTGCDETVYKIELEPTGNKIKRRLTVRRNMSESDKGQKKHDILNDPELAIISKAYSQKKPDIVENELRYTGTFAREMPNDIGNAGQYIRYESKMGVGASYIERFRGNDRPGEAMEASLKAVDEFTDLLIGYLETELGKEKAFPKLRKFVDTELRKDFKNVSAYSYLFSNPSRLNWAEVKKDDQDMQANEVIARVTAYVIERGYVKPSDVPLIKRTLNSEKALKPILKRVTAKAGITDKKFIERLALLLSDAGNLEASFESYLKTTPQYKKLIKEQKPADVDANGKSNAPSAVELVINPLFKRAVHFQLDLGFGSTYRLDLRLTLPVKPSSTNGKWNAKDRTVTWKGKLTKRDGPTTFLPEICYALWSKPDEKFQTAHFGKVILTDESLMNYSLWREGLNANEAKRWDARMMKFKPGDSLDLADSGKPTPYTEGLTMLRDALKEEEPATQPADE
jgi:hypothetical protein